jgi:hypothetical protein
MPEKILSLRERVQGWLDALTCPVCKKSKEKGKPFCLSCFHLLPTHLKKKMYLSWADGFAEHADEAREELKGVVG